jgi:hypothetical protein
MSYAGAGYGCFQHGPAVRRQRDEWPLLAGERLSRLPPVCCALHLRTLGYLQRIVNLHPKIAHGALELGVFKEELNRPKIFRAPIDQRGSRAS